jgi:DNA-directed RNA polymerase subunit RPC12/RpoP
MEYQKISASDNYIYANIQLGLLKENGIDCHLKDENTVTIDPFLSPMIGGMKIMVAQNQVPRALELLQEAEASWLATVPCPACGQKALEKHTETRYFPGFWPRLRSMLVNGSPQEVKTFFRCGHCGRHFPEIPAGLGEGPGEEEGR